jgi:hypothetical protein
MPTLMMQTLDEPTAACFFEDDPVAYLRRFTTCRQCRRTFKLHSTQPCTTRICHDCRSRPRVCETCGRGFPNLQPARKVRFCSPRCRSLSPSWQAAHRAEWDRRGQKPRRCRQCGKLFTSPRHPEHIYCSRTCFKRSPSQHKGGCGPGRTPLIQPPRFLPSRKQIAAACAKIREGWDEEEQLSRLRPDWRPVPVGEARTLHDRDIAPHRPTR